MDYWIFNNENVWKLLNGNIHSLNIQPCWISDPKNSSPENTMHSNASTVNAMELFFN